MKKMISLFLSLIFLSTYISTVCAEESSVIPELNTELLENGDFEYIPVKSKDWSPFKGEWENNPYLSYLSDPLNENNHCIKLSDFKGTDGRVSNPWVKQEVNVIPGAKYILKADVYSEKEINQISSENGYALIKLEFFNQNSGESKLGSYQTTEKRWMSVSHEIEVPATASGMRILLRQQGVGHIYFDNVSLKLMEVPKAIHIETDEVFYYSDHVAPILVTATINTAAYPAFAEKNIDFCMKKGGEAVSDVISVSSEDNVASFSFPIALLKDKQSEYTIEARIHGYSDPICATTHKIYKYDRPKTLGSDGTYYKMKQNQKTGILERTNDVVQPVFAYRYRDYQFDLGIPNGIIIAQLAMPTNRDGSYYEIDKTIEYLNTALDNAKNKGAMCMIALYRNGKPAGHEDNYAVTERVVQEFCNHEALFAWMVMDETFNHFAKPHEDLRKSYVLIRNNDPNHPVYLCEASSRLVEAGRYADILCVDPYPASLEDLYDNNPGSPYLSAAVYPAEKVADAVKAVNGNKPVYSLLQAFRWADSHPDYFPTGDEMRNMLYQSFIAGASGIGFFKFDNSDGSLDLNQTPLWEYITEFSQNELKDAFDTYVYNKNPIFSSIKNEDYLVSSFYKNNVLHVIVLNRRKTEEKIAVHLINTQGTEEVVSFSGFCASGSKDTVVKGDNILTACVPPGGAALYKIIPDKIRSLSSYVDFENEITDLSGGSICREDNGNQYLNAETVSKVFIPSNLKNGTYRLVFKFKSAMALSPQVNVFGIKKDTAEGNATIETSAVDALGEFTENTWIEYTCNFEMPNISFSKMEIAFTGDGEYDDIRILPAKEILLYQNGKEVFAPSPGSLSARFLNTYDKKTIFVLALYQKHENKNCELVQTNMKYALPFDESDCVLSIQIPTYSAPCFIKSFIWDPHSGLSPFSEI